MYGAANAMKANKVHEAFFEWMPPRTANVIAQREDLLRVALAPFLQHNRLPHCMFHIHHATLHDYSLNSMCILSCIMSHPASTCFAISLYVSKRTGRACINSSICRYTSYGRHFTASAALDGLNHQLEPFIRHEDTIVDFSCGANEWLPMLKSLCATKGKQCHGRAYDIITPLNIDDFVEKSWFDVVPGALTHIWSSRQAQLALPWPGLPSPGSKAPPSQP